VLPNHPDSIQNRRQLARILALDVILLYHPLVIETLAYA
jgi:hypothetical protein